MKYYEYAVLYKDINKNPRWFTVFATNIQWATKKAWRELKSFDKLISVKNLEVMDD